MNQDKAVARPAPAPYLALALQTACHAVNQCPNAVSYTHLTLPTKERCRSRWSPYH